MSAREVLINQYRYPLPAPPPFFVFEFNTSSIPITANTKVVPVTGMQDPANFGITLPVVQISMITTGFQNPDIQLCGYQNYNPTAGTLDILVNNIYNATTRFLIFVSQESVIV
jgi:hypothetical protein